MVKNNNPLTLDQIKWMDGEPVWVEFGGGQYGRWGIVSIGDAPNIRFSDGTKCIIGRLKYGKEFTAYAHSQLELIKEKWEPCESCKGCDGCKYKALKHLRECWPCYQCINFSKFEPKQDYCEKCGRPITEEAWEKLEWRIFA